MKRTIRCLRPALAVTAAALSLGGCMIGPGYERPVSAVPASYRAAAGWVEAQPADAIDRGAWWARFDDPVLDELAARVEISNQNVAAATASYAQARALVRAQRASLFPSFALDGNANRIGTRIGGDAEASSSYRIGIGAGWEPDVWGRLQRSVESASASAQASAADLASAQLSAQGEVAANYFLLRQTDAQIALLEETIAGYRRSLEITQNRYDVGVIARTDVLQAQTQLANTQADAVGLRLQRAQFEHAIAVLVGRSPSEFSLPAAQWNAVVPPVPIGIPSTLLQRRPDIAAAERRVAAANEQIGIAQAAFYPSFNLTGSLGLGAGSISALASASSVLWSLGVSAAQILFDAGATRERVVIAQEVHAETVARYRQTVLAAFQGVENLLTATRVLEQEEVLRRQASDAAAQVSAQVQNRYQAGQVGYTEVVIAQATALNARRALVRLMADRQTTAVALIQALGGGWEGMTPSAFR